MPKEKKTFELSLEMPEEMEVADYANVVNVRGTESEVVLTFLQVIFPMDDKATQAKARAVARLVVPPAIVKSLVRLLQEAIEG